jgi:NAD(P)-dependent dehydrogenase (short-subunit alcohol dehydrogenase family)
VHSPDLHEADMVVQHIRENVAGADVQAVAADFKSQAEVRRLADTIKDRFGVLDVLVNNAAAVFDHRTTNGDGIELTLAVNYVAVYLLTRLLVPTIQRSADGRVITVVSEAHRNATLNVNDLQSVAPYERFEAYGRSKLADLLFSYELARRIEQRDIAVLTMHPGTTRTTLFRPRNSLERVVMPILDLRARTPERSADTVVWLATDAAAPALHGLYVSDRQIVESSPESQDPATASDLWNATAELTGLPS